MNLYEAIALSYTRTCPLACRHCITESSPKAKGKMSPEQARRYLEIISRFTKSIGFTGGEPLLFHREIVELTRYSKEMGLEVALVTGAGWVKAEATARRKVQELAKAGLDKITISWDAYHEEFLPRDRPVLLARLAVEAGLVVSIRTILPAGEEVDGFHTAFSHLPVKLEIGRVIRLGHATELPPEEFQWVDTPPKGVCGLVLRPVIEPDGTVHACCGPSLYAQRSSPLVLGNAESEPLEEILARASRDPILEVISLLGPYGLYLLLKDHPTGRSMFKARSNYTGICELCLDVTNSPEFVEAIRERLQMPDVQALIAAKRRGMENKPVPERVTMRSVGGTVRTVTSSGGEKAS